MQTKLWIKMHLVTLKFANQVDQEHAVDTLVDLKLIESFQWLDFANRDVIAMTLPMGSIPHAYEVAHHTFPKAMVTVTPLATPEFRCTPIHISPDNH